MERRATKESLFIRLWLWGGRDGENFRPQSRNVKQPHKLAENFIIKKKALKYMYLYIGDLLEERISAFRGDPLSMISPRIKLLGTRY